jgi:hypothetical protein
LMKHLIKNGFTIDYEMWVFHGEKLKDRRRRPEGVNESQSKFLSEIWTISQIKLDVPFI